MFTKFITRLKNWGMIPVAFLVVSLLCLRDAVKSLLIGTFGVISELFTASCMLVFTLGCFCLAPLIALCTFIPKWDFELSLFEDHVKDEWNKTGRNVVFA